VHDNDACRTCHPYGFKEAISLLVLKINSINGILVARDRSKLAPRFYGSMGTQKFEVVQTILARKEKSLQNGTSAERLLQALNNNSALEAWEQNMQDEMARMQGRWHIRKGNDDGQELGRHLQPKPLKTTASLVLSQLPVSA